MPKSMPSDGQGQLFCLSNFTAQPSPPSRPKPKKTTITYTYQLNSDALTMPTDRVPASKARDWFGVKRLRPGMVYERPTPYGGKWIAVCVGINPKRRNENLWDVLYQQAS
jgi:hypothetical protein